MPAAGATSRKATALLLMSLMAAPAWAEPAKYPCLIEPFRDIKLATPSSGVLEHVLVDRGDVVTKGQLVARLTSAIEEAELAAAQIKARDDSSLQSKLAKRQLAEARWTRLRNLTGEAKYVSQAQLEQAEAETLQARADVQQAQTERQLAAVEVEHAQAKLAQRRIVSPFDGVVSKRDLSEGEFGYEQQPVLSLVQLDPLSVELFLPVSAYGSLREGDDMTIDPQAPIGGHYVGKVSTIDRAFDSKSGTFGVRISLPNPDRKLPSGIRCTASK